MDEKGIRFSLAFGPILVEDYQPQKLPVYFIGQLTIAVKLPCTVQAQQRLCTVDTGDTDGTAYNGNCLVLDKLTVMDGKLWKWFAVFTGKSFCHG